MYLYFLQNIFIYVYCYWSCNAWLYERDMIDNPLASLSGCIWCAQLDTGFFVMV